MNTRTTLALIAAISTLATPVVVNATGSRTAAAAPAVQVWVDPPAQLAAAPAVREANACARKVRVVYQGYGAMGDGCAR